MLDELTELEDSILENAQDTESIVVLLMLKLCIYYEPCLLIYMLLHFPEIVFNRPVEPDSEMNLSGGMAVN